MSLEAAIRTALLHNEAIKEEVEERIFLGVIPEGEDLPAIVTMIVYETPVYTNQGITNAREATSEIEIWAKDYHTVRQLLEHCRYSLVSRSFSTDSVTVGTITEELSQIFAPVDDSDIWQGVLTLSTPYRYKR